MDSYPCCSIGAAASSRDGFRRSSDIEQCVCRVSRLLKDGTRFASEVDADCPDPDLATDNRGLSEWSGSRVDQQALVQAESEAVRDELVDVRMLPITDPKKFLVLCVTDRDGA